MTDHSRFQILPHSIHQLIFGLIPLIFEFQFAMAASVQFRPQSRDLEVVMREVDEDLAVFLGMRSGNPLVLESHDSKGRNYEHPIKAEMSDDWLLEQADTSLLPFDSGEVSSVEAIPQMDDESLSSSTGVNIRPLSLEHKKPARRATTPTLRKKPKPSRASTPTPRTAFPSCKPHARSSTPTTGSRSSTPASRASTHVSVKSAPRSTTPSITPSITSCRKTGSAMSKNPSLSRGASPTVKSRPSKPSEMLTLSRDGPQNVKAFASRASSDGKPRQKSCSPAKVRAPSNAYKPGSKILSRSRAHGSDGDDVNPVLMGTKMVHRVVNMRKLAPPKQDEYAPHDNHRKSSHENSGFGRSLSKNSLEMALRHMDIGLGIADKLRPTALSSARFSQSRGFHKSGAGGVLESPPSSSCDSSKSSMGMNSHFLDE